MTAVVEQVHWSPAAGGQWGVCSGHSRITIPTSTTVDQPEGYSPGAGQLSWPVRVPTLVIWHRKDCLSCQLAQDVFARLEANPRSVSGEEFTVVRMEATEEQLKQFPHVRALPTFDIVRPRPGAATTAYGPGTEFHSVPNNVRGPLEYEFPAAFIAR